MGDQITRRAYRAYRKNGIGYVTKRVFQLGFLKRIRHYHPVYWKIAPAYCRTVYSRDVDEYSSPVDPYKIERVDPVEIDSFTGREFPPWRDRWNRWGRVRDGDWDRRTDVEVAPDYTGPPVDLYHADRFEETILHRSMRERFENGVDWTETEFVREVLRLVSESDRNHVWHVCRTESEILQRCRFLDELYSSMATRGCLSQRELARRNPADPRGLRETLRDEIVVDVGRDGELLFVSGRHRLSIAKLLDLDRIPVAFLTRHEEWMASRDAAFESGSTLEHPDLRELREKRA